MLGMIKHERLLRALLLPRTIRSHLYGKRNPAQTLSMIFRGVGSCHGD